MNRFRSFSSVPKEEMHLSVPRGIMKEFRDYAKSMGFKPNEFMTYMLCDALSRDPAVYGLHPFRAEVGSED